jgi:hypothetical protein
MQIDNTQTAIISASVNVLVKFEITEIEDGEQVLIKSIELVNLKDMQKDIEDEISNYYTNQLNYITNFKWQTNDQQ